jgi:Zn-dependent protease
LHFENGALLLFRWFGINVYLHWLWVFLAYFEVAGRQSVYTSRFWSFVELLAIFAIILMHEFGHALACRQVGGSADRIILWPLGGVALIRTPNRPGAVLWSVAAGPLVNVLLIPVTLGILFGAAAVDCQAAFPDLFKLLEAIAVINVALLVLNILPFYPLDGGQILQALLWFVIGQARSVFVASVIGLIGAAGLLVSSVVMSQAGSIDFTWFMIVSVYLGLRSWAGIGRARALAAIAKMPRREDAFCPHCGQPPLLGDLWTCDFCHQAFDLFECRGVCPNCAARRSEVQCIDCLADSSLADWLVLPVLPATTEDQKRVQSLFDDKTAITESRAGDRESPML